MPPTIKAEAYTLYQGLQLAKAVASNLLLSLATQKSLLIMQG
jgi:hypothetical protein